MDLATNKRGLHEFEILEGFEAGLVLLGHEVKAAKGGQASLKGAYVTFKNGELFLVNAAISKYKLAGSISNYDDRRDRKLLVRKTELMRLVGLESQSGLTLLPLSLYTKGQLVKLHFGVARKKKKYDKRQIVKERDVKRSIDRALKQR